MEEEVIDCVTEIGEILSEIEDDLKNKEYHKAVEKIRKARSVIEDLREDDESDNSRDDVEMDIMKELK